MVTVSADTRTRFAVAELGEVACEGGPSEVIVSYLSDGSEVTWKPTEGDLPAKACPDLITLAWNVSGVTVSATVELVASRYCTLDDIRNWRAEENDALLSDGEVWQARAKAEAEIETAAMRTFQPVLRMGFVDRPNCTTTAVPLLGDSRARDLIEVVRAEDNHGRKVQLRLSGKTALVVANMRCGDCANVVLKCGMTQTPPETRDAVASLAKWHLLPHVAPDNATSATVGDSYMRFVVGGVGGAFTSLPEVNAFIDRYGFNAYQIG